MKSVFVLGALTLALVPALSGCETVSDEVVLPPGTKAVLLRDFALHRLVNETLRGEPFTTNALDCVSDHGELLDSRESLDACYERLHCEISIVSHGIKLALKAGYELEVASARRWYGNDGWGNDFTIFSLDIPHGARTQDPYIRSIRCGSRGDLRTSPIDYAEFRKLLENYVRFTP